MPQSKLRRFACERGHDYVDFEMWSVTARSKENNIDASSGPLCVLCYIQWLRDTFPTHETIVERPTVVLGETAHE